MSTGNIIAIRQVLDNGTTALENVARQISICATDALPRCIDPYGESALFLPLRVFEILFRLRSGARFESDEISVAISLFRNSWTHLFDTLVGKGISPSSLAPLRILLKELIDDVRSTISGNPNNEASNRLERVRALILEIEPPKPSTTLTSSEEVATILTDAVQTALAPVVSQFDPNDRFAGLDVVTNITRQTQIRRAIVYSWDENYAILRPKVGANAKTTKGKNTIASLARIVWDLYCEKEKWDGPQLSSIGYPNLKAYEVALREQAERNPRSFRWAD